MQIAGIKRLLQDTRFSSGGALASSGELSVTKKPKLADCSVKSYQVEERYLSKPSLNPLHPTPSMTLADFSIDSNTYEELKKSGLDVKVVKKGFFRSYEPLYKAADLHARRHVIPFSHSTWLKREASWIKSHPKEFSKDHPFHTLELNLHNKQLFKSYLNETHKDTSLLSHCTEGSTLGYLSFNEHEDDKDWLHVHHLFVHPSAQSLGVGTKLIQSVAGISLANKKHGVEFDNPYLYPNSASFYKHHGLKLIQPCHSKRFSQSGCAQLKFRNIEGQPVIHPIFPKRNTTSLEFKKLSSPDPGA